MTIVTTIVVVLVVLGILYRKKEKSNEGNEESSNTPMQVQTADSESNSIEANSITTMEENNQEKSMRKQVSCILHKLVFKFEETDNDLRFDYEGIHMLIMFTDDENYLSILVPGILDADKDNELTVLRLVEKMNNQLKYVKAFMPHGESLWLSYERHLYE